MLSWVYCHSFLLLRGRNAHLSYTSLNIKSGYSYIQKIADNIEGCILCAARKKGAGILMFFVYSRSSFGVILFAFCLFASFFTIFYLLTLLILHTFVYLYLSQGNHL